MTDDDVLTRRLADTLAEATAALPPPPPDIVARLRTRQAQRRRRTRLSAATCALLVFAVATLIGRLVDGGAGGLQRPDPGSTAGDRVIRIWSIQATTRTTALRADIDRFNETSPNLRIELSLFSNDRYKQLVPAVIGSPAAPDVFFNWGGGGLAELARAGQVVDLSEAMRSHPTFADAFLPTVLAAGQVDGRQYGLPMTGVQPSVLFYNKQVFADAGLAPPQTYSELLNLVDEFKARQITPIALAGEQGWPQLMYLMYLTDRIGGPKVFADILAGRPGAWSHPALVQAAQMSQELAERGAFGGDFASLGYDGDVPSRRLAEGAAAMHLMGTWEYANLRRIDSDFVRSGRLGWVPFPAVDGGLGDRRNVVGSPANYFSVTAASAHVETAVKFLLDTLASDGYLGQLVVGGEAPGLRQSRTAPGNDFNTFTYGLAVQAPSFTLSWDQALRTAVGITLNANVRKLFLSQQTPEQFVAAMAEAR